METTNVTLVNFYITSQIFLMRSMEGFVAQVKLFNSQGTLVGAGWHSMELNNSTSTDNSVISSFAALIDPNETYYMEYSIYCKFTSQIKGVIRLGDMEALGFDSGSLVSQYTIDNHTNPVSGATIIANQSLPYITYYRMPLPNAVQIGFY